MLRRLCRLCRLLHVVAVGVLASGARATPTDVAFQPHTIAELELGLIALPNAPISIANQGGATPFGRIGRGDATLQTGIHVIYRGGADWAVGPAFQAAWALPELAAVAFGSSSRTSTK